jgi:putative hemolysin
MSAPAGDIPGAATGIASGLVSIPVFVALNALFVAAEFALVAVRRTRVAEMVAQGVRGARRLERATADLDRYIAATQLGITLASIGLGWLGQPALAGALLPWLERLGNGAAGIAANSLAFGIAFASITFLHVVLGELAPKTLALQLPDRAGLWVAPPLLIFERVFRPFIWALNRTGNLVVRAFGLQPTRGPAGQMHSVAELSLLLEASERAGVLEREEREMMHGVLAIGDMTVRQVLTPREEIVSVRVTDSPQAVLKTAIESGYSRLPVVGTQLDDVQGVLHTRDLLHLFSEEARGLVVLQDLIRQPQFVRASTRVLDLLRDFQRGEQHLAFVLDDFGELLGIVTLEDLLEEIVGEICDESDTRERLLKLDDEGNFIAAGAAPARECLSDLGVVPPLWAGGSLAGFLRRLRGGGVRAGERLVHADLVFTVLEADAAGTARSVRIEKRRIGGGAR